MKHVIRNTLLSAVLAIGLGVPYLHAADVAISALPAGTTLAGTEAIPAVQSGATVKTTPSALKTYVETSPIYLGASAYLYSTVPNITEFRNSTNANTVRVFDTFTDLSNYGRIALNTNLTGDWVQVAAETAGTGGDNYGIALTPTGTGAISAHVPDSTAAGGNARGANAVDWQPSRSLAVQAATGANSTIGGGISNAASGASSVVSGGTGNTASGTRSTVGGGDGNEATMTWATASGGASNLASGTYSWVPGGVQATTRGLSGAGAYSAGLRAAKGDAQVILQPVRRTTTDATPVSLATDGTPAATTVMVLPSDSTATCQAIVTANTTTAGVVSMAGFRAEAIVKNDSSTMTISGGTCTAIGTADAALTTATCALVANGTLDSIEMQVTGVAATTVYWVAEVKCVQAL